MPAGRIASMAAALAGAGLALGIGGYNLRDFIRQKRRKRGIGVDMDAKLAPIVQEMSTCPAAKALLSKVVEQQQQRGAGPLRVRCLPTAPPGKWQPEGSWDPLENTILVQCNNDPKVQVGTLLFELLNAQEDAGQYQRIRQQRREGGFPTRDDYAYAMESVEYTVIQRHHQIAKTCWPHELDPACCPRCPPACTRQVDSYKCCVECGPCTRFADYYQLANTPQSAQSHPDDCHAGAYRRSWDRWQLTSRRF